MHLFIHSCLCNDLVSWDNLCCKVVLKKTQNFDFIWCSCHKLIPQLPLRCTCQASLCPLLLIGWVALLPWHLVATATRSLAPIHHPDQDWHLMTSSLPIRQACCYYECPSVCHFQLSSGGFKNWCSRKWNGELKKKNEKRPLIIHSHPAKK